MILQALTRCYKDLLQRGEIAAPGWSPAKISFALCLDADGRLTLPAAAKKTSGVSSNFLWENSGYLLGIKQGEAASRSQRCFDAAADLHHTILDGVDTPVARAILAFFDCWQPQDAAKHPALSGQLDEITAGGNLLFRVDGCYPQEDPAIREAWNRYTNQDGSNTRMQCLVTGRMDTIPAIHPSMHSNAFSLIFVSPVRSCDSDSTDYLYSPCSTASVYQFFISVIKRLFCCGLRGLFPWEHYTTFLIIRQETISYNSPFSCSISPS